MHPKKYLTKKQSIIPQNRKMLYTYLGDGLKKRYHLYDFVLMISGLKHDFLMSWEIHILSFLCQFKAVYVYNRGQYFQKVIFQHRPSRIECITCIPMIY